MKRAKIKLQNSVIFQLNILVTSVNKRNKVKMEGKKCTIFNSFGKNL
jgi:hypothetical protein